LCANPPAQHAFFSAPDPLATGPAEILPDASLLRPDAAFEHAGRRDRSLDAVRITEPEFLVPDKNRIPCFSRQAPSVRRPDQNDPRLISHDDRGQGVFVGTPGTAAATAQGPTAGALRRKVKESCPFMLRTTLFASGLYFGTRIANRAGVESGPDDRPSPGLSRQKKADFRCPKCLGKKVTQQI
jgi:hypothetical protein